MGMCAIYTAVPASTPDELYALARSNESKVYGANRRTLGRRAVAELVALVAPPSHAAFARTVLDRDLWGFLTPAATRGNHLATLQAAHEDLAIPTPLWPNTAELACLVGVPPARYVGNNLAHLPSGLVLAGAEAFSAHEATNEVAHYLYEFLRDTSEREQAALLHWDYR
jgi:hypothetical protein